MKKLFGFIVTILIYATSCEQGCKDELACNYGDTGQECKYPDEKESLLKGSWNLLSIYSEKGECIFLFSNGFDCELYGDLDWINISFNEDKTAQLLASPSQISDPLPFGNWSINICENVLMFINVNDGYNNISYPQYLPMGNQKIIQLTASSFLCEDGQGNMLYWEKI